MGLSETGRLLQLGEEGMEKAAQSFLSPF